jgi:hypothetical protein
VTVATFEAEVFPPSIAPTGSSSSREARP